MKIFKGKIAGPARAALLICAVVFAALAYGGFSYQAAVAILMPESGKISSDQQQRVIPATEFKIMKSGPTIGRAMYKIFNLRDTKEVALKAAMTEDIKSGLAYSFDDSTRLFELTYSDRAKEYVSKIANAVAEAYIDNYVATIQNFSSNALQNLYMQQTEYKKNLADANSRYEKFCNAEKIFNIENELSILSNQLAQYNSELSRTQADISLIERNPAAYFNGDRPAAISDPAIEANEVNRDLAKKINDAEIRLAMSRRKYTDAHPIVRNEAAMLDILKKKLAARGVEADAKPLAPKGDQAGAKAAVESAAGKAIEALNAKRTTYQKLIAECQEAIKSYPRKKAMLKSYEVEISKVENILTRINRQIEDLMIFQQTKVIDNVPRIIDYSGKPALRLPAGYLLMSLACIAMFAASFAIEKKIEQMRETRKISAYARLLTDEFKIKVLGHLHRTDFGKFDDPDFSPECFSYHRKDSRQSRSMGLIRGGLEAETQAAGVKAVGITSLDPGEGKTVIAANLAITSALFGIRTLVIDFNYKSSHEPVSSHFRARSDYGLTDIVLGEAGYAEVMGRTAIDGLGVIATGTMPPSIHRVFAAESCAGLLKEAAGEFGLVLVDCPAFNVSSDFHAISKCVRDAVLVVDVEKAGTIEEFTEDMRAFMEFAESNGVGVRGVIFNEK